MTTANWQQWHVTQLTPEAALEFDKRCYGVPEGCGLGWTPYNYRVTYGAVAQWACHTDEQFEQWLKNNNMKAPQWSEWDRGIRSAFMFADTSIRTKKGAYTMKYRMEKTFIDDMGSIDAIIVSETPMETKEEQALWQVNSLRRRDGLRELDELPDDITFTLIAD